MIHEIAAAPAQHFANRRGREVACFGRDVVRPQQIENRLRVAESPTSGRSEEEGRIADETADNGTSRRRRWWQHDPERFRCERIAAAERERNSRAARQNWIEEAIAGIGVVLDVSVESP